MLLKTLLKERKKNRQKKRGKSFPTTVSNEGNAAEAAMASETNNVEKTEEDENTLNNSEVPESECRTQDNVETLSFNTFQGM